MKVKTIFLSTLFYRITEIFIFPEQNSKLKKKRNGDEG